MNISDPDFPYPDKYYMEGDDVFYPTRITMWAGLKALVGVIVFVVATIGIGYLSQMGKIHPAIAVVVILIVAVCSLGYWDKWRDLEKEAEHIPRMRKAIQQERVFHQIEDLCPECTTWNPLGSRYCGSCGFSLLIVCTNCDKLTMPNKKFCINCGKTDTP